MDPKLFFKLSYGLYAVSSTKDGKTNAQIANSVIQISNDPITVAISLNKNNLTNEYVKASKVIAVSILSNSTPLDFIGHFGFKSGRNTDKFQNIEYKLGDTGAPIFMENSAGYFEAKVIEMLDVETHTVFIGKVVNAEVLNNDEPMTYAYYHQLKRGTIPRDTPLVQAAAMSPAKPQKNKEIGSIIKYQCSICGHIYDMEQGDPDSGIAPETLFEDVADNWSCPLCGASKDKFKAMHLV